MPDWFIAVYCVSIGWVVGMVTVTAHVMGGIRARVRSIDLELVGVRHKLDSLSVRLTVVVKHLEDIQRQLDKP
jgi:hypothetical protein